MNRQESTTLWKDRKHWAWFPFSFTTYRLTRERLYQQNGLLTTHYDETMLYKVIDLCLERTFMQKIFGTGTLILTTRADSQPHIYLKNIKDPLEVKEIFSNAIESERTRKKVIGKEFFGTNASDRGAYPEDEEENVWGDDDHN
ncbi:MAG: PH domain-containing protein [Clostridiales bacterium]|nr:PH domain-containing protein [Clostridiales bacterium]